MRKTNSVEQEVDAIRDRLYEKTQTMTAAQRIAYFHDLANQAKSEYGVWQKEYFAQYSLEELNQMAVQYNKAHPFCGKAVTAS